MPQWSVGFAALNMNGCKEGDYITLGQAMDDVRVYVMYYNFVRPHRYNQGFPPVLTKTTYRGPLN